MTPTINQCFFEWSPLALLLFLPLFLLLVSTRRSINSNKPLLPPSPPKIPFIGNLHQLGSLPHRSLAALSDKYGPIMLLHLGQVPTLVVSSPEISRHFLKTHDQVFASRPSLKAADAITSDRLDIAFAPYSEYWRQLKKLCVTHFLSPKMVQSFKPLREEEVGSMIAKISRSAASSPSGVVNMSEILNSLLNNIICRLAVGKVFRKEGRNDLSREMLDESIAIMGGFYFADYFPKLAWLDLLFGLDKKIKKDSERWDEVVDAVIEEHEERSKDGMTNTGDLVEILLSLQKDPNMNFAITKERIKALLIDIFTAGTDTSYITLEWSLTELVRNSEAMKKLQDEVRAIAGGKAMVAEEDLSKMSYLKAVIKETLRLHPPAPLMLPHESMEKCQILGYEIPKKTRVYINVWAICRDPKVWEAPDEFRPERFIDSPIDFRGNDFEFTPFGAGRRFCPGMNFAVSVMDLALANLMNQFDWGLPDGMTIDDLDMTDTAGFSCGRKQRLELVAKPSSI